MSDDTLMSLSTGGQLGPEATEGTWSVDAGIHGHDNLDRRLVAETIRTDDGKVL